MTHFYFHNKKSLEFEFVFSITIDEFTNKFQPLLGKRSAEKIMDKIQRSKTFNARTEDFCTEIRNLLLEEIRLFIENDVNINKGASI